MNAREDVLRQLLEDICFCLHRHEVQTWKDCPGTLEERSVIALQHAREGLALLSGKAGPRDVKEWLADRISRRDVAASGGIVDAP